MNTEDEIRAIFEAQPQFGPEPDSPDYGTGENVSYYNKRKGFLAAWQLAFEAGRQAGPEWLTIETAPRDGTSIILLYKGHAIEAVWECVDSGDWESGQKASYYWSSEFDYFDDDTDPTHWMPLPQPPQEPQG